MTKDIPSHPEVALGVFNPNGLKRLVITRDDPKDGVKLPAFLETQKLRDVHKAAVVYWQATGNRTLMDSLATAVTFAENVEDTSTVSECIVCGDRVPKGRKYCGFDCAETDGAIEK
jgi:hypothetical protein